MPRLTAPLIALALTAATAGMAGTAAAAPLAFSTCATRAPVQCGTLTVPLDHADPAKGSLNLHVERLRATAPRRGTLVMLAGGPGQAGTPMPPNDPVAAAVPAYDVVMLDQRGTGKGALRCRALDAPRASDGPEAVGACAQQVGPTRAYFATRDSVQDLEMLRQALGVEQFALGGISYGTYVTQYYARDYPSRVSHMVLDSVVDPARFDGFDPPMFESVSPVLTALCAGSRCTGITPDPVGDLAGLVTATATQAIRGYRITESGRRVRSSIGGPGNQEDLPLMLAAGDMASGLRALWPGAARAARYGDAAPMLRLATLTAGSGTPTPPSEISSALFYATVCADAALPWTTATPIAQRAAMVRPAAEAVGVAAFAPFSIDNVVPASAAESCTQWPEAATDPLGAPVLPAVPTILLDGGQDTRTPVASAQAVAARIPGSNVVVAPGAGHSLLYQYSCAQTQMRNLLYGRRVSAAACNREAPVPRPVPVPPATLSAVKPSGATGTAGRVAQAARYAVQDGVLAMDAATESGLPALPGLRAGTARPRGVLGSAISYSGFSAVRGVAVTGTLRFNGSTFQGALKVNGPGTWDGLLYLARGGTRAYTGSIGGVAVRIPLG